MTSSSLRTVAAWIAFAVVLACLPMVFPSRTALTVMNLMGIWVVFALAYNMLLGQSGMLSFGHAVYFGLGGYAAIHMIGAIKAYGLGIPVFGVPIIGFMAGIAAGAVIGSFSCRRAGTPFAMISLGIGELIAAAGFMFITLFGGEEGISGDRTVGPQLFGLALGQQVNVFYLIAFWVFVSTLAMWAFTRTPLGRLANAVRDNPDRVSFIGYNPQRVRFLVFMISGGFAGLAGALLAVNFEIITPETLGALNSGTVLLMTYIGGVGVFYGPILGAVLITFMNSMLSDYTTVWQLYLGLLFVVMIMFAPFGIGGIVARIVMTVKRGELAEKLPIWLVGLAGGFVAFAGAVLVIEMTHALRDNTHAFVAFGRAFDHAEPLNWMLAAVLLGVGIAILVFAKRMSLRDMAAAPRAEKEAQP